MGLNIEIEANGVLGKRAEEGSLLRDVLGLRFRLQLTVSLRLVLFLGIGS